MGKCVTDAHNINLRFLLKLIHWLMNKNMWCVAHTIFISLLCNLCLLVLLHLLELLILLHVELLSFFHTELLKLLPLTW